MLEQIHNTVQQISIFIIRITGSDVTGSGIQRESVFSHDLLDHGTGLMLRLGQSDRETKIKYFKCVDSCCQYTLHDLHLWLQHSLQGYQGVSESLHL